MIVKQGEHTPGPWCVEEFHGRPETIRLVDGDQTICIASLPNWHHAHNEELRANAALIARAPELLAENGRLREALERLLGAFRADAEIAPKMDVLTAWETNSQAIAQAEQALAGKEKR